MSFTLHRDSIRERLELGQEGFRVDFRILGQGSSPRGAGHCPGSPGNGHSPESARAPGMPRLGLLGGLGRDRAGTQFPSNSGYSNKISAQLSAVA